MQNMKKKAFTLVELLVVITILAIISVVAYQNFWWAVDKAVSGRKISDVSTIETSLQQYKVDKNYYPTPSIYNWTTNLWWYNSWTTAFPSNTIDIWTKNWEEILTLDSLTSIWGGIVYWTWTWTGKQIWAKWTMSRDIIWKKYLSKDLYDPEVWDIKVWSDKMIEKWLWRYIYAIYKKSKTTWNWTSNMTWTNYNLAMTIKESWTDKYITKIVWDYDEESCYDNNTDCPNTLIWSWTTILIDWQVEWEDSTWTALLNYDSKQQNQWVPYPVTDFAQ